LSELYEEIVERIRGETPDLGLLVQKALRVWTLAQQSKGEQEVYLDSVALNIHGFYSGLERLFELIARRVDQVIPGGETWHRDLLHKMAEEVPGLRPAVISAEIIPPLDELHRFRHLVRNVYAFNLVPDKMKKLMLDLPGLWSQLKAELLAFAEFLSELALSQRT
jgi:hypothetical protein